MIKNKIVFTNGCFDILHAGHIRYLEDAKKLGDILVVGLNSDRAVKLLKGEERPVNNEEDRKFVLSALRAVDKVIVFDDISPLELIKEVKPDVLVKGGDWEIENIIGANFVMERGGKVYSLKFYDGYSTTNVIEQIKNKE